MGDVIGDLNSRRGRIEGMEHRAGAQVIRAFVPLAEMFGYSTDLQVKNPGAWQLLHGIRPLRRSTQKYRRGDYRQGERRLIRSYEAICESKHLGG